MDSNSLATAQSITWTADRSSGRPSLRDAQRSRHVSSERTHLVELRALGSTGSSAEGVTVPSLTNLPTSDRQCSWPADVPDRKASSLRTEDHSALKDPAVPRGLLRRAGMPGVLLPVEVGPAFPWGSLVFLFVPSRPLSRLLGGGTPRAGCGIPAGQRPVALVGVTGFEPAASSSRTTGEAVANGR